MKKISIFAIAAIVIAAGFFVWWQYKREASVQVTNFEECVAAGNPVMESYPRQCRHNGQTFTEDIGNELQKVDLIRIDTPRPNQVISSPLTITGEARGSWFFEASFPVVLTDWDGLIIAQGIATTKSDWMTSEFVPFEAKLTFTVDKNAYSNRGILILRKDNPSDLPEHDDALEIPVVLAGVTGPSTECTQEAKLCPDGSYVGRTGPNCEFAPCPVINPPSVVECKKDADCPSPQYICQETQGTGTACSNIDPSCVPTHTLIKGECKLKEGSWCSADSDCAAGNLCHKNICVSPVGRQCSGPSDTSCLTDFECVQGCGPPVVRYPDDTPPKYFCQLKGYNRSCPICLAENTLIDTPLGEVPIQQLREGMIIWTTSKSGERVAGFIVKTGRTPVTLNHWMVQFILDDGRKLLISPGHPTVDGRAVGNLIINGIYDGARVVVSDRVLYNNNATFDILPSGETGFYWANGILLDSTLH